MALPHRTQILYLADIAFITSWLDIRRGSRVIEAGEKTVILTSSSAVFPHSIHFSFPKCTPFYASNHPLQALRCSVIGSWDL